MDDLTKEEQDRYRRMLDSNFKPGLVRLLVEEERKREPAIEVDTAALKQRFIDEGCPSWAPVIDFLAANPSLGQFGSGSITAFDSTGTSRAEEFTLEGAARLQELYIGDRRTAPMIWLGYLGRSLERFPDETYPVLRKGLERVGQVIKSMVESIARVMTEESDADACDAALEPTRFN